ncbi:hypothetical protein BP00DRAFT_427734 [Aspergillus indologenus CBS 114.80]|uniref:Uncharacterized protein n=1 Tax=Aspergillus indologenus CBS 114.80 TaxID=1450541 RepID=A0A2V5I4W5_9EURO|nr:hypothetical protein BP00DRAFT_427734 [Aspergillus indologenus CBS 114.80]
MSSIKNIGHADFSAEVLPTESCQTRRLDTPRPIPVPARTSHAACGSKPRRTRLLHPFQNPKHQGKGIFRGIMDRPG